MAAPVVAATASGVESFLDHIDLTIDCTGTDGLLLCFTSGIAAGTPIPTPTYNASNMTSLLDGGAYQQGVGGDTASWYTVNPPAGSHTLHVPNNGSGGCRGVAVALFLTGVHQTVMFGTTATTSFYSAGTFFQDVSGTATDDLVIGFAGHYADPTFPEDGGATNLNAIADNNAPASRTASLPGTGGTVTMGWTGAAGNPSVVIAIAVKAATASVPTTGTFAGLAIGLGR
jgi:hypothetical protein